MINFKVIEIENFINNDDLKLLTFYAKNLNGKENIQVFHNEIDKNNKIYKSSISNDFLIKLNKTYCPKAIKILETLCPEKVKYFSYSDFTIIKTKKNQSFPIHDDTFNKLLSGVIYLYPSNNIGTFFYSNKKGDNKKVIKWKINKAVFFSRKERETWHSYAADNENDRITLVFNLMTKKNNLKNICKIEKKNYFFSKIRYLLNPYIYRIFKKII